MKVLILIRSNQGLFANETSKTMGDEDERSAFFTVFAGGFQGEEEHLGIIFCCCFGFAEEEFGRVAVGEDARSGDIFG